KVLAMFGPSVTSQVSSLNSSISDDRGEYRLFGVPPGEYLVVAMPPLIEGKPVKGFIDTYYPSAANPSMARPVFLKGGAEVSNINIAIHHGETGTIFFNVIPSSPEFVVDTVAAKLTPRDASGSVGISNACGMYICILRAPFKVENVPEGDYILDV